MAAPFLLGYDPRIDTAPDFSSQAGGQTFQVPGPGNAHPNHMPPTKNPTYAGTLYPTGQ